MGEVPLLLRAAAFAAEEHREQTRKGVAATPYINHPLQVAELLAEVGGERDAEVLCAALLHDTIEDCRTPTHEIEQRFGARVRGIVEEVTDDKALPKQARKQLQIEHAPHLSDEARRIKLADKICNVRDITHDPPADWPHDRLVQYLDWAEAVVEGLRGASRPLAVEFDRALAEGRARLGATPAT